MAGDDVRALRLVMAVDGAQAIPAAMKEASAATQAATTQISTSMETGRASISQTSSTANDFASGITADAGAAVAFARGMDPIPPKTEHVRGEITEAKHAIHGFGEEIGLRIPRFIQTYIANLEGVAPIAAAAFSGIAIIGIIQLIGTELPAAIEKAINSLRGWDAEAKAAWSEEVEAAAEAIRAHKELEKTRRDTAEVGLSGEALYQQKLKDTADTTKIATKESIELIGKITDLKDKIDDLKHAKSALTGLSTNEFIGKMVNSKEIEKAEELLKSLQQQQKTAQSEADSGSRELHTLDAERRADSAKEEINLQKAEIDGRKKVALARIAIEEESLKSRSAMEKGSVQQDADDAIAIENEKYKAIKAASDASMAVAKKDPSTTPASMKALQETAEADELAHQLRISQIKDTAAQKNLAVQRAELEDSQRIALAKNSAEEAAARNSIAISDKDANEEASAFLKIEDEKYSILQDGFKKRMELAKADTSKDPAASLQEQNRILADEEAAAIEHETRMADIKTTAAVQNRTNRISALNAELSADRAGAEQTFSMQQSWIEKELAAHRISIEQETAYRKESSTEQYESERTTLQKQLDLAKEFPEKNKAEIIKLNADLNILEEKHQEDIYAIDQEGEQKQRALRQRMLQETQAENERDNAYILAQSERANNMRLADGEEFIGRWSQNERGGIEAWYENQREVLQRSADNARRVFGALSPEYQKALDRMTELDRERVTKLQAVEDRVTQVYKTQFAKIGSMFDQNLRQWALGQQTFRAAMVNIWNGIVLDTISALARIAMKHAEHWALVNILHVAGKTQEVATEAAGAAAKHAVLAAENTSAVISEAAVAGAAGFASVMEAVPFPINIGLAPGVAAEAFGATAAFAPMAAFEHGGIVPQTDFALLHKKEMVLPADLSEGLQHAIRSGESTFGRTPDVTKSEIGIRGNMPYGGGFPESMPGSFSNRTVAQKPEPVSAGSAGHVFHMPITIQGSMSRKEAEVAGTTIARKVQHAIRMGSLNSRNVK